MNWMQKNRYTKELKRLSKLRVKVTLQAINGEKETQQCRGEVGKDNQANEQAGRKRAIGMTWGERIDTRLHAKDSAAKECMEIVRALAAERDTLQGLLKKSLEREEQIEKELSEARAQVAVLLGALEFIADTTSHKRAVQLAIRFVATTPTEAAERVQKLVEALEDCRNLISKTEFPTVAEQADNALSEWRCDQ